MTMTDDPDFLDELLTRYLDGEATDDEVARVEADPALLARARQLRAVVDLVASPITIPTADLDRIRAAALAQSATSSAVSDLDSRRAQKLQNRNRILAAAAVFVFLAVGFAAIQSGVGDDSDDTTADAGFDAVADDSAGDDGADAAEAELALLGDADASDSGDDSADDSDAADEMADDEGDDMAASMEEAESAADDAAAEPRETLDVLPDDLGAVGDLTELADRLSALKAEADAEARFAPPPLDPFDGLCDPALELLFELLPAGVLAVEIAPVVVSGLPQQVALATGFDGSMVAVLIADEACQILEVLDVAGIDGG